MGWDNYDPFYFWAYILYDMKRYRSFKEARKFAQRLGLKNGDDYKRYYESGKVPDDIPKCPWAVYSKEWKGMGNFLGTGNIQSGQQRYRSFTEARKFARKLGLKDGKEWHQYCKSGKKPDNIPKTPHHIYSKEWEGVGDFLGTGFVFARYRKFRSFVEARKFARSLKLKTWGEWKAYTKSGKLPDDIPANPIIGRYEKEWISTGDWLGTGRIANQKRKYRSYNDAKKFVQKLKLKNKDGWEAYTKSGKKPDDIPQNLREVYKKEWEGWGIFLGTGRIANQKVADTWLSAKEARIVIKKIAKEVFGGKPFTQVDWMKAHNAGKIPKNLPKYLDTVYDPVVRKKNQERGMQYVKARRNRKK